jgi:hypothetical protein
VDFVGPITQVRVDPLNAESGRSSLMVKLPSSAGGPVVTPGQEVELGWHSRDAYLVPAL